MAVSAVEENLGGGTISILEEGSLKPTVTHIIYVFLLMEIKIGIIQQDDPEIGYPGIYWFLYLQKKVKELKIFPHY